MMIEMLSISILVFCILLSKFIHSKMPKKCLDYLHLIREQRAFLVLCYTINEQLLDEFLALPQLEYIYLFGREAILKKKTFQSYRRHKHTKSIQSSEQRCAI